MTCLGMAEIQVIGHSQGVRTYFSREHQRAVGAAASLRGPAPGAADPRRGAPVRSGISPQIKGPNATWFLCWTISGGIGAKRRQALWKHFGTIGRIRAASEEELASAPGMNITAAQAVHRFFVSRKNNGRDAPFSDDW